MSIQFWIWLIVIVITLIARASKKKTQEHSPDEQQKVPKPDFNTKPMTFEELLREIQATKVPPQPSPIQPKKADYEDYDDNLEEEEKDLEKPDYNYRDEDSIYETYEKAKREAFARPSLEETVKLQDTVVRFGQFKGYQPEEKPGLGVEILKEFHDPEGFRKAFIMGEILNRKF